MLQTSSHLAEHSLLRPSGTLCHFSLDPLRDELAAAVDAGTRRVIVDLAAVELLSAAAVGLLLEAAARLEATRGALVVTGASGLVAEVVGLLAPELAAGSPSPPMRRAGSSVRPWQRGSPSSGAW